ncbi:MAG: 16S rRNA (cytosine(967)-C(5))-methyltransferase RsmB [Gemmatimonadetes bacterium]|nr:16S rRNA (cytosine(967)-C(5))-methyltransferase RsmB [Gemmatimonadota bacterium]NIO31582.1 16S rRNA (cytosine(967)-C(5))-methyltransferase RsmB [Gemmatimonadota bacterium]
MAPARSAALEVLRAVRRGVLADRAFERCVDSLAEADRRLTQELAYGVLRLRGRLDYLLAPLVEGGLGRLDSDVIDILRLGAYQLVELDRVPAYAAVSDSVELAKASAGRGVGSLTNAVLRRVNRQYADALRFPGRESDPVGYLSTWGSHPRWLVERWLARAPLDEVEQLVEYNNTRPAVHLSVVDRPEEALRRLRGAGIRADPVPQAPNSLRIDSSELRRALGLVRAIVQDPGAAAVLEYMALDPGGRVVDLCAAPGGKAALLAARGHQVLAFDVAAPRLARILETRSRLGLSQLHVARADSTRPPLSGAEVLLLDAPCTGTGTLARHPDGRWRLEVGDLESLTGLQQRLLEAAAKALAPGGLLVYATCSLEPEENEGQVEAFLNRHVDFGLEAPAGGRLSTDFIGAEGELRILPQRHGMDGTYAARLRHRLG